MKSLKTYDANKRRSLSSFVKIIAHKHEIFLKLYEKNTSVGSISWGLYVFVNKLFHSCLGVYSLKRIFTLKSATSLDLIPSSIRQKLIHS